MNNFWSGFYKCAGSSQGYHIEGDKVFSVEWDKGKLNREDVTNHPNAKQYRKHALNDAESRNRIDFKHKHPVKNFLGKNPYK